MKHCLRDVTPLRDGPACRIPVRRGFCQYEGQGVTLTFLRDIRSLPQTLLLTRGVRKRLRRMVAAAYAVPELAGSGSIRMCGSRPFSVWRSMSNVFQQPKHQRNWSQTTMRTYSAAHVPQLGILPARKHGRSLLHSTHVVASAPALASRTAAAHFHLRGKSAFCAADVLSANQECFHFTAPFSASQGAKPGLQCRRQRQLAPPRPSH